MRRTSTLATMFIALLAPAAANAQNQPDLSALPDVIKGLKWKEIDLGALPAIDRCRALQFLNDALTEISASGATEADLMSTFIDQQKLGPEFASRPPPADAPPFTYDDAMKIAIAMLRGPLAQSSYATGFTDADQSDPAYLEAYTHLFQTTCHRKWAEVVEAKTQVRSMAQFLQGTSLIPAYQAWVPQEAQRREQAYQAQVAQRRAALEAKDKAQQEHVAEVEKQHAQQQAQQQAAAKQMQQALASAHQSQSSQPSASNSSNSVGYYPPWGYGGVAGVNAYGWAGDAAHRGAAAANTEQRYNNWHGAAAGRR